MTRTHPQWKALLDGIRLPAALVDMDALDANIETLLDGLGDSGVTLRVASKSVRCVGLLRHIMEKGGTRFRGLMTFSAYEAAFLAEEGFDDFLMGYPVGRRDEAMVMARLVQAGGSIIATVDAPEQCALLDEVAREVGVILDVCIDVDASWRPAGGAAHLGVRRSPVRTVKDALAVAKAIEGCGGLKLSAVLAYEAQIAGMRGHNPTSRHLDPIRRFIRARSKPVVLDQRRAIVEALRASGADIEVVNGGGTGSLRFTSADPSVTEVTAGSGFLCPHLFDHSEGLSLRPAAFFALSVVRASDPGFVTCAAGGYIASGGTDSDRSPIVHSPKGLETLSMEGWGEVQTPFKLEGSSSPGLGDPVICRHAKAGELGERFHALHLVRGDAIIDEQPTYRGQGHAFM